MNAMIAVAVVFAALPFIAFRGVVLRRYLAADFLFLVFALIVARQFPALDGQVTAAAFGVVKLVVFSTVWATAPITFVRWSANRAGIVALLIYLLTVPAMLRTPPDGDEPFYLLVTESLVHDGDFDLANQYRELDRSATRRTDLKPQPGDPVGPNGEQYSRHEPFLSILLIPGFVAARIWGAIATIVLFGALLARATVRFFEEESIDDVTTRAVFPLFAFGPPLLFYATRIWPEVPAAFFFVEAIRGVRQDRMQRWLLPMLGLVLLKLRFVLVALPLALWLARRSRRQLLIAAVLLSLPILIVWLVSGNVSNVHSLRAMVPYDAGSFARGFFGLLIDGAAGLAFQAPFYLIGFFGLARWKLMPDGFRLGVACSVIYILFLIPRAEWHGGWAPPLRYIVFLMPVLALGAAAMWRSINTALIGLVVTWTAAVTFHGVAWPWRLFHIANGENLAGEALSRLYGLDFSRFFPSLIRPNRAALVGELIVVLIFVLILFRRNVSAFFGPFRLLIVPLISLGLAALLSAAQRPSRPIHFEDAHVEHRGGELYPHQYTVARFLYQGGWILRDGDRLSFRARSGRYRLRYSSAEGALIAIDNRAYQLPPTGTAYGLAVVEITGNGRTEWRVLRGAVNLDRLD